MFKTTIKIVLAIIGALTATVGTVGIAGTILSVRTPASERSPEMHRAVDAWEDLKNYFR